MNSPGSRLTHWLPPPAEDRVSCDFRPTAGGFELSVQLASKIYQVQYETPTRSRDGLHETLAAISERYEAQAGLVAGLDRQPAGAAATDQPVKMSEPMHYQVWDYLRCQEALEMTRTLESVTDVDQQQVKKHEQLLNQLRDRSLNALGAIRNQLRNRREGSDFVRGLLQSNHEILIDLGTRLTREPSMRPALQDELMGVVDNEDLPLNTRQRAYDHLWAEIRQLALKGSRDR